MATLLAAVDSVGVQAGITLAADHLVTVVLLGELAEGGLDEATPQTKHQVQGRLFLNVERVRESADFSFDILNGVTGHNLKGDGLASRVFTKICISASAGEAAQTPQPTHSAASFRRKSE